MIKILLLAAAALLLIGMLITPIGQADYPPTPTNQPYPWSPISPIYLPVVTR